MKLRRTAALLGALLSASGASAEILHVSHHPLIFDPAKGESTEVRFRLTTASDGVALTLFDARELSVRTVRSQALSPGDHRIAWDGRDDRGRPVPPEAYTYMLEATGPQSEVFRWQIATSGGERVEVADVAWDPKAGAVRYRLADSARVRIRIGLADGGPLLRTLVDWAPRVPGSHAEPWDGRDASNVLALAEHPALLLEASAFALPRNAVLLGPPAPRPAFVAGLSENARRFAQTETAHRMFDYAHQSASDRSDYLVHLTLPEDLEQNRDGVPIVRGPIPVRVEASSADLARAANERTESVFFVDGRYAFERETGFLPMTWTFDPAGHAPGLHHLTANIRGYEGHFGIGTVRVWVESPASAASR